MARISHNMITNPINIFILGVSDTRSLVLKDVGVSVMEIGSGVSVGVGVDVSAGKINVTAGRGMRVVVGVIEGVAEGVNVADGAPNVAVGVFVPAAKTTASEV